MAHALGCISRVMAISLEYDSPMEAAGLKTESPRWFWIAGIWCAFGLLDATQTVVAMRSEGMHHAWRYLFLTLLLSWIPWALATPLVMRLGRRFPPFPPRRVAPWFLHLAACAVIGAVYSTWVAFLERLMNPWLLPPQPFLLACRQKFYNSLLAFLILYTTILAVGYVLDSRERLARQQTETARLSEQLSNAQLSALRQQIEPHFLFNTLNAISGLVREQRSDDAVSMIAGLSRFLRRTLEGSNRQEVALAEEMKFLQEYLDIQKVRFGDRLRLSVDVGRELFPAQVPSLILQPMVENAIKHGISKRAQGGAVRIAATRSNGMLTLSVYNDGPALPSGWENAPRGIGMSNLRTRLQGLYGTRFAMSLRDHPPGGVEATVSVPFREC